MIPEILVVGYARSGTSLVTELAYILKNYPKPRGMISQGDNYAGYNEFIETFSFFHYCVFVIWNRAWWEMESYKDNPVWNNIGKAGILAFLHERHVKIFKENHLLTMIGGFPEFRECKILWVKRDDFACYRSYKKAFGDNALEYDDWMKDKLAAERIWRKQNVDCFVVHYEDLKKHPGITVKEIAQYLNVNNKERIMDAINFIK